MSMASHSGRQALPSIEGNQTAGHSLPSGSNHLGNLSPDAYTNPPVVNLGLLKSFNSVQKKVTRDGQPPKRRGPKPDSKPAQTHRQVKNRQAQRTHRERKENYLKNLEAELSRSREDFTIAITTMKNELDENQSENAALKDILVSKGIAVQSELDARTMGALSQRCNESVGPSSPPCGHHEQMASLSLSTPTCSSPTYSHGQASSNRSYVATPTTSASSRYQGRSPAGPAILEQSSGKEPEGAGEVSGIFERNEYLGVEFILCLESYCRDHGEYLVRRSMNSPDDPEQAACSGHALMASCPPPSHISTVPALQQGLEPTYPLQAPGLPMEYLRILLNTSKRMAGYGFLDGGQVTPIMALQHLRSHPDYLSLTLDDVRSITTWFSKKIRCYGFGAVMEDFELEDGLQALFASKCGLKSGYHSEELERADDL